MLVIIHIGFLCVAGIGILFADHAAFSWLRGKRDAIGKRELFVAHWIVTIGLAGLILTGTILFWPMRAYLITQPFFWTKMGFVFTLLINSFAIEYLMHEASHAAFASLSRRKRMALIASGALSTISWVSTALIAFLNF